MLDSVLAYAAFTASIATVLFLVASAAVIFRERRRGGSRVDILELLPIAELREALCDLEAEEDGQTTSGLAGTAPLSQAIILVLVSVLQLLGLALPRRTSQKHVQRLILLVARAVMSLGLLLVVNHPLVLGDARPRKLGIRVFSAFRGNSLRLLGTIDPSRIRRIWESLDAHVLEKLQDELAARSSLPALSSALGQRVTDA